MSKVHLEACMWDASAGLGELPPYFMAQAARPSDHQTFEATLDQTQSAQDFATRANAAVQKLIHKIPNPLFDLAGITCGHFLVPFWNSRGENSYQNAHSETVIITFSRHTVEQMATLIGSVPLLGAALQKPFREYFEAQKAKLHHRAGEGIPTEENWRPWLFEKVVVIMVCFFVCSIVNSVAQSYAEREILAGQGGSKASSHQSRPTINFSGALNPSSPRLFSRSWPLV